LPHTRATQVCNHLVPSYNMSLLILPSELLFHIVGLLGHQGQVYALARSCRGLYCLLRKYLLQYNIRYSKGSALIWAAKMDRRNLVERHYPELHTRASHAPPGVRVRYRWEGILSWPTVSQPASARHISQELVLFLSVLTAASRWKVALMLTMTSRLGQLCGMSSQLTPAEKRIFSPM
jgi:hypothetical protein